MTVSIDGSNGVVFNDLTTQNTSAFYGGLAFRNRIINGAMVIDQRNAGASGTSTNAFAVDRWGYYATQASKGTWQQNAGSVTPPAGFGNYLGFTSSSAYSVVSSDTFAFYQGIEGFNMSDFNFGSANAATITLSFWVRSSLTGTFGGAFKNYAGTRAYPFTYTISTANTWELETVTIPGDTSGTWVGASANGAGFVVFGLGQGSSYAASAGAWATGDFRNATGATSVVGTSGATFYITGVQLEKGSTATSFDYRPIGTELALCQRYYWKIAQGSGEPYGIAGYNIVGNAVWSQFSFPTTMRATPTVTVYGTWVVSNCGQPTIRGASSTSFLLQTVATATAAIAVYPNSSDDLIDASIEL